MAGRPALADRGLSPDAVRAIRKRPVLAAIPGGLAGYTQARHLGVWRQRVDRAPATKAQEASRRVTIPKTIAPHQCEFRPCQQGPEHSLIRSRYARVLVDFCILPANHP